MKCIYREQKIRKARLVFRGLLLPHMRKLKAATVVDYDDDADSDSSVVVLQPRFYNNSYWDHHHNDDNQQ